MISMMLAVTAMNVLICILTYIGIMRVLKAFGLVSCETTKKPLNIKITNQREIVADEECGVEHAENFNVKTSFDKRIENIIEELESTEVSSDVPLYEYEERGEYSPDVFDDDDVEVITEAYEKRLEQLRR